MCSGVYEAPRLMRRANGDRSPVAHGEQSTKTCYNDSSSPRRAATNVQEFKAPARMLPDPPPSWVPLLNAREGYGRSEAVHLIPAIPSWASAGNKRVPMFPPFRARQSHPATRSAAIRYARSQRWQHRRVSGGPPCHPSAAVQTRQRALLLAESRIRR